MRELTGKISFQGAPGAYSHQACARPFPGSRGCACEQLRGGDRGGARGAGRPRDAAGREFDLRADRRHPPPAAGVGAAHRRRAFRAGAREPAGAAGDEARGGADGDEPGAAARAGAGLPAARTAIAARSGPTPRGRRRRSRRRATRALAALASELAGEIYGLEVLARHVEDQQNNTTRFLVMAPEPRPAAVEGAMTTFVFRVRNIPAALYKAMGGFATNGVNMTKLESYMVDGAVHRDPVLCRHRGASGRAAGGAGAGGARLLHHPAADPRGLPAQPVPRLAVGPSSPALEALDRRPTERHGIARRANAMLLLDHGLSCEAVARVLYLDDDTVRGWHDLFRRESVRALSVFGWKGGASKLTPAQEAYLTETLTRRLYPSTAAVMAHIERTYGVAYSKPGAIKLLHRLGFEWRKPTGLPARADVAAQEAFVAAYEALLNCLAPDETVYFADAVACRVPEPARPWLGPQGRASGGQARQGLQAAEPRRRALPGDRLLPDRRGRQDHRRDHGRALRQARAGQPGQAPDPCHPRQCRHLPRPAAARVAGAAGLPHQADLPARVRPQPQRHRALVEGHAPAMSPTTATTKISAPSPKRSCASSPPPCHKAGGPSATPSTTTSTSSAPRNFGSSGRRGITGRLRVVSPPRCSRSRSSSRRRRRGRGSRRLPWCARRASARRARRSGRPEPVGPAFIGISPPSWSTTA